MANIKFIEEISYPPVKMTVIEPNKKPKDKEIKWRQECMNGNEIIYTGSDLFLVVN